MAESTITKILLRRGPDGDLKLNEGDTGAVLDMGEPGFTTNTYRLYIGDGVTNRPIPHVDGTTLVYNNSGVLQLSDNLSTQIKTSNTGDGCGDSAAICAPNGGIYASKNINCGGDVISFCSSDERLKNDIKLIDDPLEKLTKLRGVTFEWSALQDTYQGRDTGILAQDLESTGLPGVVQDREDGYKAVKYDRVVALLIESVKQLNQKVEQLTRLFNDGIQ